MHARAEICKMCGGKFFPASMPHHIKACAKKNAYVVVSCPYCNLDVCKGELESHAEKCPAAKKAMRDKKAAQAAANAPLPAQAKNEEKSNAFDANEFLGVNAEGLVPCQFCQRTFNQDRIAKHSQICQKLKAKEGKKTEFNSFKQRQFDPLVKFAPAEEAEKQNVLPKGRKDWREESKAFREATKAAKDDIPPKAQQPVPPSKPAPGRNRPVNANAVKNSNYSLLKKPTVPSTNISTSMNSPTSVRSPTIQSPGMTSSKSPTMTNSKSPVLSPISSMKTPTMPAMKSPTLPPIPSRTSKPALNAQKTTSGADIQALRAKVANNLTANRAALGGGRMAPPQGSGGIQMGNHTSTDNPLATNNYMTYRR